MKSAELAELDEPRHDHLDVHVRRVVPEVDERERARPQLFHAVVARAPVVEHRRIERRLVHFVLDEQPPCVRQCSIDGLQTLEIPVQRPSKVNLPGKVASVPDPDRVRPRTKLLADRQTFQIVLHRLPSHGRIGVSEAPVLV